MHSENILKILTIEKKGCTFLSLELCWKEKYPYLSNTFHLSSIFFLCKIHIHILAVIYCICIKRQSFQTYQSNGYLYQNNLQGKMCSTPSLFFIITATINCCVLKENGVTAAPQTCFLTPIRLQDAY